MVTANGVTTKSPVATPDVALSPVPGAETLLAA